MKDQLETKEEEIPVSRGKAKKPTLTDIHGEPILDVISVIRRKAFEIFERLNGPSMLTDMTDDKLGIKGIIDDLKAVYKKYEA